MGSMSVVLNRLIEVCFDGYSGYQTAAEHAPGTELRRFLGKLAMERKVFGEQLGLKVDLSRDAPHDHGTVTGALHRQWIEIRDRFGGLAAGDLLRECVRGEMAAVRHYEDALSRSLPDDVHALIAEQLAHIQEACRHLAELANEDHTVP